MRDTPEDFVKKTAISSFYMTTGFTIFLALIFSKYDVLKKMPYIIFPIFFVMLFFYFLKLPEVRILKRKREISEEIVFAGRFLIIELESGIPLYNALLNISKNFKTVGAYFKEIIDNVDLGASMEDAIGEALELTPSQDMRKILWQITNSIKTGADVTKSLGSVLEQITKEQIIEIKKYGRKLNPLAMFYMIVAVILPSIGITMVIVLSSFLSISLNLTALMVLVVLLGFMQYMFIAVIKANRPTVNL